MEYFKTNLLSLVSALILFVAVPLAYAWTAPRTGVVPPNENVKAPISISSVSQTKEGKLGVFGLGVFGQTLMNKSATSSYELNVSNRPDLTLGVNGKIGADEYCDKNGLNCVTTLGGTTTGGGTGTSTATTTLPSGSIQVRIGPAGCNYLLTTSASCKTLGYESCSGEGCESRYLSCAGGVYGRNPAVCPTKPVDLIVRAAPSRGTSLDVSFSPGVVYRLGNLDINWIADNIPSGVPVKLEIKTSTGAVVYTSTEASNGSTSKTVPLTDIAKFVKNGVYRIVASATVDGKVFSDTSPDFTTLDPVAEFSLDGEPTIVATNNASNITTKIDATFPMKVKVTGGNMTKPVIADFTVKFNNPSISPSEVDDTTPLLVGALPATLAEGNHKFTIKSSYTVPAAQTKSPTVGSYTASIKSIKSKFGALPVVTTNYTDIVTPGTPTPGVPTAEFSMTGDPTIVATPNASGITTKITVTYPLSVVVANGVLTKPVIADFDAVFIDNNNTQKVDSSTAISAFPTTINPGTHQFTVVSTFTVPTATPSAPTTGQWKAAIKSIKSKFGTSPVQTDVTPDIVTPSVAVTGKY